MRASVITRIAGTVGLIGLAPIAYALASGARTLPEAALAAVAWAGAVLTLGFVARLLLEQVATRAERAAAGGSRLPAGSRPLE